MKKLVFRNQILLSLFSVFALNAQSQVNPANCRQGENHEYCGQHKRTKEALANDPEFAKLYKMAKQAMTEENKTKNPGFEKGIVYTVPVVFHIIHNGGIENISDAQVESAMEVLNRDFALLNPDAATVQAPFQGMPANIEIQFKLAKKAPNGTCFKGITRTQNAITSDGTDGQDQVNAVVAGNDIYQGQWAPNKYLNIYVCQNIGGAAGYTFNPLGGSSMFYNGIFVLHNYTGAIGTGSPGLSRTLTHEVGHWINLSHVWGDNNDPGQGCGDDEVLDTPFTTGSTTCNFSANTCNDMNDPGNDNSWTFDVVDNVENYMDYSYCNKMFTEGQKARMRAALTSSISGRNNLYTAANHIFTGINDADALCKARFSSDKTVSCVGESITFTDLSLNVATGWTWTFTGGTPSTSTSQNPVITYSTPGTYSVTLVATDGTTTDDEVKTGYITILPASSGLPFVEGFEGMVNLTGSRWTIDNNGGQAWAVTTTAGNSSSNSVKLNNFNETAGQIDELISNSIDLSSITAATGATLSFRFAYRKKATSNTDVLRVLATKNCGTTWEVRKTLTASTMSTTTQTSAYTPAAADWITTHVTNITSQYWVENFRMKFQFTSNSGNNIYLDNINIYPGAPSETVVLVGIEELNNISSLYLYPNPSEGELNLSFSLQNPENLTIRVTDISGKVMEQSLIQGEIGTNLVLMNTENYAAGMYLVHIQTAEGTKALQFIVQ